MTNAGTVWEEWPEFLQEEYQRFIAEVRRISIVLEGGARVDAITKLVTSSPFWEYLTCMWDEDKLDPIGYFWKLYELGDGSINRRSIEPQPGAARGYGGTPAPDSGAKTPPPGAVPLLDGDEAVLATLEWLYERYKVPYEPDEDAWDENEVQRYLDSGRLAILDRLRDLITFLHVAAARAFTIKRLQGGGLDEVALDCLREVERTNRRLYANGLADLLEDGLVQTFHLSADAVAAKACAELGRVSQRQGRYAEALHYFTGAAYTASYATQRYLYLDEGGDSVRPGESERVPLQPSCDMFSHIVAKGLDNVSPEEIAAAFLSLKASGQADDWSRVAWDCGTFLIEWVPDMSEWVEDDAGASISWGEFWYGAKAWASAQLSPNEYRKLREADEKDASARRLRNYFFGKNWDMLPKRAKDRLVTADTIWNSQGRMAWEAVLSDLRIATEDILDKFVVQPLNSPGSKIDAKTLGLLNDAEHSREHPKISFFSQICQSNSFKDFLQRKKVVQTDVDFLTRELPKKLDWLRKGRNSAEHETGDSWQREEVQPFFCEFLGIGRKGVLPELARIGQLLRKG